MKGFVNQLVNQLSQPVFLSLQRRTSATHNALGLNDFAAHVLDGFHGTPTRCQPSGGE
jgi:hypothetical protein